MRGNLKMAKVYNFIWPVMGVSQRSCGLAVRGAPSVKRGEPNNSESRPRGARWIEVTGFGRPEAPPFIGAQRTPTLERKE